MFHSMTRRAAMGLTGALALGCLSGAALADGKLGSPDWDYEIVLGGGSATGNSRVLAGALGKIVTENVQGVRASGAVSPGFDAESAIHVHDGSFQGGVGTPLIIANAVNGVPPFPKEGIALKFWFYHNEVPLNVLARTDTGFTKISDLKGATVAMAPRGTSNYQLSEIVFGNEGVLLDDVRIRYMDTSEAISQLQNGNIDAMSYVRDYSGAVLELTTARDITLLQPSEEGAAKTSEKLEWSGPIDWPFVKEYASMNVPAPGQAFVSPEFMFLDADLPDDLVYAMTRAVWENIEVVNRSSKVFAHVNLQEALKRVPIAPHPGAIRYYKEMNVPGWEKYADLLPAE